jgi:hypothetical protein
MVDTGMKWEACAETKSEEAGSTGAIVAAMITRFKVAMIAGTIEGVIEETMTEGGAIAGTIKAVLTELRVQRGRRWRSRAKTMRAEVESKNKTKGKAHHQSGITKRGRSCGSSA